MTLILSHVSKKRQKEQEKQEAIEKLRNILSQGQTVYTSLQGVSSSGMSRKISVYIVNDGEIEDITYLVARALDYKRDVKTGALKVSGAGMDMGFHVVYSLSYKVFNSVLANTGKDAGYFLKQRWL